MEAKVADPIDRTRPAVVKIRDVSKAFRGRTEVLRAVSLDIAPGEAIALVGSNGAGKSTLLRCMVGLIPISHGSVEILGETFTRSPSARQRRNLRRRMGFVFQFHGLVGRISALSNVVQGALGQGYGMRAWHQTLAPAELRERALDALDRVGLADRAHDRAESLSGGQSQRVAIARALVHRPDLVIADEPVASLDPVAGQDVMQLFRSLTGPERTLVFTTHNVDHALAYSDRVIALRGGKVVIDAATATVDHRDLEAIYRD